MILSGAEIRRQIELGTIEIDPYDPQRVNQTSVDLTLGDRVAVHSDYVDWALGERDPDWVVAVPPPPFTGSALRPAEGGLNVHDSKRPARMHEWTIDRVRGWVLIPGIGYLMHTAERIKTTTYNPVLDGKSSLGRLFVQVHATAGYGEPGFDGQYTLEVSCKFPVRVYPGMRFCQIRFHRIEGEIELYTARGRYQGDKARGPVGSQLHESGFDDVT